MEERRFTCGEVRSGGRAATCEGAVIYVRKSEESRRSGDLQRSCDFLFRGMQLKFQVSVEAAEVREVEGAED